MYMYLHKSTHTGVRVTERVPSLVFIVQSTVADPQVQPTK